MLEARKRKDKNLPNNPKPPSPRHRDRSRGGICNFCTEPISRPPPPPTSSPVKLREKILRQQPQPCSIHRLNATFVEDNNQAEAQTLAMWSNPAKSSCVNKPQTKRRPAQTFIEDNNQVEAQTLAMWSNPAKSSCVNKPQTKRRPAQPSPAQPSPPVQDFALFRVWQALNLGAQPSPAQPSPAQPSPAQPSPAQPKLVPQTRVATKNSVKTFRSKRYWHPNP